MEASLEFKASVFCKALTNIIILCFDLELGKAIIIFDGDTLLVFPPVSSLGVFNKLLGLYVFVYVSVRKISSKFI